MTAHYTINPEQIEIGEVDGDGIGRGGSWC